LSSIHEAFSLEKGRGQWLFGFINMLILWQLCRWRYFILGYVVPKYYHFVLWPCYEARFSRRVQRV
jgi:hypothetical protein